MNLLSKEISSGLSLRSLRTTLPDGDILEGLFGFRLSEDFSGVSYSIGSFEQNGLSTREISWEQTDSGLRMIAMALLSARTVTIKLLATGKSQVQRSICTSSRPSYSFDTDDDGNFDRILTKFEEHFL